MTLPVKPLIPKPVQYGLTGAALGGTLGLGVPYVSGTLDPSDYIRGGMMALTMGTGGMLRGRLTDLAERFTHQGEELAALRAQMAKHGAPAPPSGTILGPPLYPKTAAPWGRIGVPEALDLGLGALSAGQMANWALSDNMDAQHKPVAAALGAVTVGAGMTLVAPKVEALLARVQRPFWAGHWLNKATRELTQAAEQGNGEAAQMLAHISTPHGAQEVIDAQCRAVAQGAMPLARYGIGVVAAPLAVEAGQMASEQINPTFQDQVASTFGQARGVRRFWG